jgi:CubicO group peptidase (beta-lactamase class C family)
MLAHHSGGTGDFFGPEYDAQSPVAGKPMPTMALFGARAPQFIPGSRDAYSNYGYLLLGNIIEKVSGQSFTAMSPRIFSRQRE